MPTSSSPTLSLRPISQDDLEFLYRVYASTRYGELAPLAWSDKEQEAFLRFQFQAQHDHYQEYYPEAKFDIILEEDQPVGRLYVDRWSTEIRIMDIALLPEYRGRGIGTTLLRELICEARDQNKVVSIHVEHNNPAMRLYTRLGFKPVGEQSVYLLMEWKPDHLSKSMANT